MLRYHALLTPEFIGRPSLHQARIIAACAYSAKRRGYVETPDVEEADRVIMWGLGNPAMAAAGKSALARGAHFVTWDLGYFMRRGTDDERRWRVSVDAMHPDEIVMARDRPPERWDSLGIALRNEFDPDGPVILVGMGRKSAVWYGEEVGEWERDTALKIEALWPDRRHIFRPKPGHPGHCQSVPRFAVQSERSVEAALSGASLVVVRHSNVAIDAVIAGVPVVASGGIAAAVVDLTPDGDHEPLDDETRLSFLRNAAWFEYSISEMTSPYMWDRIEEMIEDNGKVKTCNE